MKKRRKNYSNWQGREFVALGNVGAVLLDTNPDKVLELRELCRLADVTEKEALTAIMDFSRNVPLKFYWANE